MQIDNIINSVKLARRVTANSNVCDNFAILKMAVLDNDLKSKYIEMVDNHNKNMMERFYPDSGFDLLFPQDVTFDTGFVTKFVDLNVKTEMLYVDCTSNAYSSCAFTVYPRSSISKSPLMLANQTGIIDSGYRGNLIGAFRWLKYDNAITQFDVSRHTRLLQACHPTLCPVYVVIVEEEQLSTSERGAGGFGSTGK
jgi:dUTP pyrophosphatase